MGDGLVLVPDDESVNAVEVQMGCPRCHGRVRVVARQDPKGYSARERRIAVECTGPHGHWAGVLVVELLDMDARSGPTGARAS